MEGSFKNKKIMLLAVILLFPPFLFSCQTIGGKFIGSAIKRSTQEIGKAISKEDSYNFFYDQGDHLEELIKADKFEEAADLYVSHKVFFQKKIEKYQGKLILIADKLNNDRNIQIKETIKKIESIVWPTPYSQWVAIKDKINNATNLLEQYDSQPMLLESNYRSPFANILETKLNELTNNIKEDSSTQFSSFNHFSDSSFFKLYPTAPKSKDFMDEYFSLIQNKIKSANTNQIKQFISLYPKGEVLSSNLFVEISNSYVDCHLREKKEIGSLNLQSILTTIKDAQEEGFEPTKIPNLKMGFAEATSKTDMTENQNEFPYHIEIDIPFQTIEVNLNDVLSKDNPDSLDYLIVIDVAVVRADGTVIHREKVSSKYVADTRSDPNPEYEIARFNVTQAQNNLANAQRQSSSNNPYASPLANLIGTIAQGAAVIVHKNNYNKAMAIFNSTPQFIEKPIYQTYEFSKLQIDITKILLANYYIIDFKKNIFFKSSFKINEKQTFDLALNVNNEDTSREEIRGYTNSENQVSKWKKEPVSISLSNVIDHYLANIEKIKKLYRLSALREEISKDKNLAMAQFRVNIEGEANYTYGDDMSLVQARKFCKGLAIRNALENYYTFLMSETKAKDFHIESDKIWSLVAGYVRDIIEKEKREEGRTIYYRISGYVDKAEMEKLIKEKVAMQKP